ncbi:MAG: hypothetical protein EHM17_08185 [Verrucomicrobiaceae bacterium]|nr:MAG: hypothetical protein EHM17_08185 [Verrucomicrobiaceae bacterium]
MHAAFLPFVAHEGQASSRSQPVRHRPAVRDRCLRRRFRLTTGDMQYVAFYDSERRMTVGSRKLPATEWTFQ